MPYLKVNQRGSRVEAAKKGDYNDRLIQNHSLSSRQIGPMKEKVHQVMITVLQNADREIDGVNYEALTSCKLQFSSANAEEAKAAWEELKQIVDHAFSDQSYIFSGIPLDVTLLT